MSSVPVPVRVDVELVEQSAGQRYHRTRFDAVKKAAYVRYVRQGIRRVRAAELVGVTWGTVWEHLKKDEAFHTEVSEAEMARIDEVEEAMYETALAGNVVAQQVILFNRRADEWQRVTARSDPTAELEAGEEQETESAKSSLRTKLNELRERLTPEDEPAPAAAEPEPAVVDDDGD